MATREEFAEAVLEELISEDSHQAANAADVELVLRRYDRKLINLIDEDYADWIGSGDIPEGAMTGLVKVMAYECRNPFGANISRDMYDEGLADLRLFMRGRALYEPVKVDYY